MSRVPVVVGWGAVAALLGAAAFAILRAGPDQPPTGEATAVQSLPPVSEAEAMKVLDEVLIAVWRGDYDVLCDPGLERYAGRGCTPVNSESLPPRREVDPELIQRAPLVVPHVVGVRTVPPSLCSVPAVILRLKGVDGRGDDYRFDFAVYRRPGGEGVFAPDVIYWQNLRVGPTPFCEDARS